jgi:DNA-binding NarL/FixJ family response regulator
VVQEHVGVFIVAGNRLLREALTRILTKKSDICVLGAAPFSPQIVDQVAASGPDILLLNAVAATFADLEFVRRVREIAPRVSIVMIGMDDDEEVFLKLIRAGVVGYVLKDASAVNVATGVRSVANAEAVCPPRLCLSLFKYVARQGMEIPSARIKLQLGLTRREQQLIPFLAQGLTNKEIATRLNLSEQTVKNHVHRMLQKLGASDRLTVVELCRIQGLSI